MPDTNNENDPSAPIIRYTPAQSGRLGFLSLAGASSNSIPLPFLPGKAVTSIRGALAHDVIRRHGLSLTTDAREIIAAADSPDPGRARMLGLANYLLGRLIRKFGPLWFLTPTVTGVEVFALGHLLNRYLESHRVSRSVRVQADEARFIRTVIDRSVLRALSPTLRAPNAADSRSVAAETDDRDDATRLVDWALVSAASLPSFLVRRLEVAFDDVVEQARAQRAEAHK